MIGMDWDNEAEVDALLRKGLLLANAPLASLEPVPFAYSPAYQRWERRFLANPFKYASASGRPVWRRVLNAAAMIIIAFGLLLGTLMLVNTDVRAAVMKWFTETFVTHDAYRFTGDAQPPTEHGWYPAYLPDGYSEVELVDLFGQTLIRFENEAGDTISLFYQSAEEGSSFQVNNEQVEISESIINGNQAYLYKALETGRKNAIIWMDERANTAFMLSSAQPCEVLIRVAESVKQSD